MKKIKSFADACKALNLKPNLPVVTGLPKKHAQAIVAYYQLVIIAQALNEGLEPDWNSGEWKYYPRFYVKADAKRPAGFGLSSYDCDGWSASTGVGSRLCFKSCELAEYAGKKFVKLYEKAYLIMK